jgi:hypothetical protein
MCVSDKVEKSEEGSHKVLFGFPKKRPHRIFILGGIDPWLQGERGREC